MITKERFKKSYKLRPIMITPKERLSYTSEQLHQRTVGEGGIAICDKYELNGYTWVEKKLRRLREGETEQIKWIRNEVQILADLKGIPTVVQLYGCYRPRKSWHPRLLTIMMEYIKGDMLEEHVRNEDVYLAACLDVARGLEEMEKKDIVHQDLQPKNIIVVPDGQAKIIDFGLSQRKKINLAPSNALFGTPEYCGPEMAKSSPRTPSYDTFALALILFEGLTGKLAYGSHYDRWNYIEKARTWNDRDIQRCQKKLQSQGLSQEFIDAWGLAIQPNPDPKVRQREPLQKALENLVARTTPSRVTKV